MPLAVFVFRFRLPAADLGGGLDWMVMMRFWVFGLLAVAGVILPYVQFVPWMVEHGLDVAGFFAELSSNQVGVFFAWDLAVSALALAVAAVLERHALGTRRLIAVLVTTFCVGVSLGLPLFFLFRFRAKRESAGRTDSMDTLG